MDLAATLWDLANMIIPSDQLYFIEIVLTPVKFDEKGPLKTLNFEAIWNPKSRRQIVDISEDAYIKLKVYPRYSGETDIEVWHEGTCTVSRYSGIKLDREMEIALPITKLSELKDSLRILMYRDQFCEVDHPIVWFNGHYADGQKQLYYRRDHPIWLTMWTSLYNCLFNKEYRSKLSGSWNDHCATPRDVFNTDSKLTSSKLIIKKYAKQFCSSNCDAIQIIKLEQNCEAFWFESSFNKKRYTKSCQEKKQTVDREARSQEIDKIFKEERGEAHRLMREIEELSQKAADCEISGRNASARAYKQAIDAIKSEMPHVQDEAGDRIFSRVNDGRFVIQVDLHGLYPEEAVKKTDCFLEHARNIAKTCPVSVKFITGRGAHSAGAAKLRPKVLKYLQDLGFSPFEEVGCLTVSVRNT